MVNSFTMFTVEENEILTRTGPGTPMGDLLRRRLLECIEMNERGEDPPGLSPADQRIRAAPLVEKRDVPYEILSQDILRTREGVPVTSI